MSEIEGGNELEALKARKTLAILMTIAYGLAAPGIGGGFLLFAGAAGDNSCRAGQLIVQLAFFASSVVPFVFIASIIFIWVFRTWKTWNRLYGVIALPWAAVFLAYVILFFSTNVPCR